MPYSLNKVVPLFTCTMSCCWSIKQVRTGHKTSQNRSYSKTALNWTSRMTKPVCFAVLLVLLLLELSSAQESCSSDNNTSPLVGFTALTPEQLRSEIQTTLQDSTAKMLTVLSEEITTEIANYSSELSNDIKLELAALLESNKELEESIINNLDRVVEKKVREELDSFFERIMAVIASITPPTNAPTTQPTTPTPLTTSTPLTTPTPLTTSTPLTTPTPPTTSTPLTTPTTAPTTEAPSTLPPEPVTPPPGQSPNNPATSCQHILEVTPNAPSATYWVITSQSGGPTIPRPVYCDMERSCGGLSGGWMRIANLNMTKTGENCPENFRVWTTTQTDPALRLCRTTDTGLGCIGTFFPSSGVSYSHVCGRVIGYQDRTPNAFFPYENANPRPSIDEVYVDGISLTYGREREHIWTFVAALDEQLGHLSSCRCSNIHLRTSARVPGFVGNDYFCDTGSRGNGGFEFYDKDPLWDGSGCGPNSQCCTFNTPPWFYKNVIETREDIELRVCRDSEVGNEDILIEVVELYVR